MKHFNRLKVLFVLLFSASAVFAQTPKAISPDSIMVTILLKHQKDKNLKEINEKLADNKFNEIFPIMEVRVISWYVMMGIEQVVIIKMPVWKKCSI